MPIEIGIFANNISDHHSESTVESPLTVTTDLNNKAFANNIFKIDSLKSNFESNNFFEPIFPKDQLKLNTSPFEVSRKN